MRTWDHFKWWLLFGLIVWLLLVAVFLIDHSRGYSVAMISERIWRTAGEIALLKWVSKYQTLIAGLGAVLGGAFVLIAGREQILFQQKEKRRERVSSAVDTFIAVGSLYSTYQNRLKNDVIVPHPVQAPPSEMMRDIAFICPNIILYVLSLSELSHVYFNEFGERQNPPEKVRNRVLLNATMLFEMFNQIAIYATSHEDFEPRVDTLKFWFDKEDILEDCRKLSLSIEDYGSYATVFKITEEDLTAPPARPKP